jgi:hypothetical protein
MGDVLAYRDPEVLQSGALMTFLDWRLALWIGELDPQTGLFRSATGRDERIDGGISEWSFYSNGPEWGLDEDGPSIFYVKDDAAGKGQLWRAEPPWDAPAITPLTADPVLHNWLCGPTVNPALPSARVIVYRGTPGGAGNIDAWIDETRPNEPSPFTDPMVIARWGYDTALITFAYKPVPGQTEPSQVTLVDTDTGESRTITADEGNKVDPWLWNAPEFGGELLLAANLDNAALALYRDLARDGGPWTRIATIVLPPDAPHRFIKSIEPINGGDGAFGRSYFTVQAGDDGDFDTSIWLFAYAPDGVHLVQRLDAGAIGGEPAGRLDPESFIGTRELFVYYSTSGSLTGLRRCRTPVEPFAPQPVHNLAVRRIGLDLDLMWDPVTRDILGGPEAASSYEVWRAGRADFSDGELLQSTFDALPSLTLVGAGSAAGAAISFYQVRARDVVGMLGE